MTKQKWALCGLAIIAGLALLIAGLSFVESHTDYQVMSLAGTGMEISGSNTDQLVVDQTSTGDIVEFRNNGTVRWRLAYDGAITSSGGQDFTGDVTVTGDVDVTGDISASGTITATTGFIGDLTGNVTGDLTGDVTSSGTSSFADVDASGTITATTGFIGDLTGNVTGDLTGDVTSSGTSSFSDAGVSATLTANAVVITTTLDVGSTLQYGASNFYPVGYNVADFAFDWGTESFTETHNIVLTNVTTPTIGLCTLGEDSTASDAICTITVSGTSATLKVWAADGSTAGTTETTVHWFIIGQD
jgi:hypothetical protein